MAEKIYSLNFALDNGTTKSVKFSVPYGSGGGAGVHVGTEAPTDPDVNVWIDTDEESSGASIKHQRYVIEYAASDLTPSDTSGISFNASEEKQDEVLGVLAQLSTLSTISVNMSVSVPSMGEIMRLPVMFEVKNEALGTNGNIASVSFEGIEYDSDEAWVNFGAISVYKAGMTVIPANYYQAIGAMGAVITIDALYL